ncbi:MAG: family 10 glycosylhydrolase [Firmicutes bacterium]|nr:family 10 glycosylhydrolase [Bacillota bacterium]
MSGTAERPGCGPEGRIVGGVQEHPGHGAEERTGSGGPERRLLWCELYANRERIVTREGVAAILDRCREVGIDTFVLHVKDLAGYVPYPSRVAPHMSEAYDWFPPGYDLVQVAVEEAHRRGIALHVAPDVMVEGRPGPQYTKSLVRRMPYIQCHVYAKRPTGDGSFEPVIVPISEVTPEMVTAGNIDVFDAVFVNPALPEVQAYEIRICEELAARYDIDGIILDRCRYPGLSADFSDYSRRAFEAYIGRPVDRWPEDIFEIDPHGETAAVRLARGSGITPGPLFQSWLKWRAENIRRMVAACREAVKAVNPQVEFAVYTGSWYPIYYFLGVNWASQNYRPDGFWAAPDYNETGFAELLDYLCTGCYYPEVTVMEARAKGSPADWYSVEGAARISREVTLGAVPVVGGLFVKQYEGDLPRFQEAIRTCRRETDGVMIFDLCYLEEYGWWEGVKEALQ